MQMSTMEKIMGVKLETVNITLTIAWSSVSVCKLGTGILSEEKYFSSIVILTSICVLSEPFLSVHFY
jgi:hypothetical protein